MLRLYFQRLICAIILSVLVSIALVPTTARAATVARSLSIYYANARTDDTGVAAQICRIPDNTTCSLRSALTATNGHAALVLLTPGAHYTITGGALPTFASVTLSNSTNLACPSGFNGTAVLDFSVGSSGLTLRNGTTLSGVTVSGVVGDAITVTGSRNVLSCVVVLNATKTGITLLNGAQKNTLSGIVAAGNGGYGISMRGGRTANNSIADSFVGYYPGRGLQGNALAGVVLADGANKNTVRTSVIGGNNNGIEIAGGGSNANIVRDNGLGSDRQGTLALGNIYEGISIRAAARANIVQNNVISGNTDGVEIAGGGTIGNILRGNHIGTNAAGTAALPNTNSGIAIKAGAAKTVIGGSKAGEGNVVSGNSHKGIEISGAGSDGSVVWGNKIGTNGNGDSVLGNGTTGIAVILGARNSLIGGGLVGQGNIISGNGYIGIEVLGTGTNTTVIHGNRIGTNAGGSQSLANLNSGIVVEEGPVNTVIGGTKAGQGNLISGNGLRGIEILGQGTSATVVQGNRIGTNAMGTAALPNADDGIAILTGATNSIIGGAKTGQGNIVSGNGGAGVRILNSGSTGTIIQGNRIGIGATSVVVANVGSGVQITTGAANSVIGGTKAGMGNIIGGNGVDGITITGAGSAATLIQGNAIGSDFAGLPFANGGNGISVRDGAANSVIGGTLPGAANRIGGNTLAGVEIAGDGSNGNSIRGNVISANRIQGIFLNYAPETPDGVAGGVELGANNQAQRPTIIAASTGPALQVNGSANPLSLVDIYIGDGSPATQGVTYLGTTTADATGHFAFSGKPPAHIKVLAGTRLVATSTLNDPAFAQRRNGTSEFSTVFVLP